MTGPGVPLGAPVPCEVPAAPAELDKEQKLLAVLRQDYPGWRIVRRPVTYKTGLVAEVWWAQRREPPAEQLREAGVLGHWFVRPTGVQLLAALSHQLAILQSVRG